MTETLLIDGVSVLAGADSTVEAYGMAVPPDVDFRVECTALHSIRFYGSDADFDDIDDGAVLTAYTETAIPSTAGTNGNVYRVSPGSYDYIACVVTNDGGAPADVTVAVGYDLVAEAPTALFTVAEARAYEGSAMADVTLYPSAKIIAAEARIRARFESAIGVRLIPTTTTELLNGTTSAMIRVGCRNPYKEQPTRPLTIVSAKIDGVAFSAPEVADILGQRNGILIRKTLGNWAGAYPNLANVEITYTHGYATVPVQLKDAALKQCLYEVAGEGSDIPSRATSMIAGDQSFALITPGFRGAIFDIPEVNQVLRELSENGAGAL